MGDDTRLGITEDIHIFTHSVKERLWPYLCKLVSDYSSDLFTTDRFLIRVSLGNRNTKPVLTTNLLLIVSKQFEGIVRSETLVGFIYFESE